MESFAGLALELLAAREKEIFHPWGQKRGVKKD
ncbi:hypothetical protein I656_00090 [Geobacillus sp. WSUCF1]|nr:hypothetical protein I656_00090 [Geobacillus sp. WSUCF1]